MADRRQFTHLIGGQIHPRGTGGPDEVIGRLAGTQRGVVARWQLLQLGIGPRVIERRIAAGRLLRVHAGIYAVGHLALSPEGLTLAGVLSAWPAAASSYWTAAWLHGLAENAPAVVEVTAAGRRRARPGIAMHRAALPSEDLAVISGIVVTSVPRTLLDLSGRVDGRRLRRLVKEAEFRRVADTEGLQAVLARHPRRPGRRALARIVGDRALAGRATRSEMEDRFLEFCARRGLPMPETNAKLEIGGRTFEIDCLWRAARLALELDGHQAHANASAFETDRARDRALVAAGWTPTRVTWTQLHRDADALDADLRSILRKRRQFTHPIGA